MNNNQEKNDIGCDKKECSGCMACKQICPYDAIEIKIDDEGFEYPVKTEKCINCGLCTRTCPSLNIVKPKTEFKQSVYAISYKDDDVLLKSSSGGAFTSIVDAFCDDNYAIFGVEFDEKFNAFHSYVTDKKLIGKYRKSKYVQSSIGDSYKNAKKLLEEGKKVLFTGTPCQIAGLKAFLNKDYENILTVDIVCHGVPSPKTFRNYLDYMEKKYNNKIKSINFREKVNKGKKWNSRYLRIEFENGKTLIESNRKNLFLRGFYSCIYERMSCYRCKYAKSERNSDITIADAWGIEKTDPNWDVHHGVSMIVINSNKGKKVFDDMKNKCDVLILDLETAIKRNGQFRAPTNMNIKRDLFYNYLNTMPFNKAINKCLPRRRVLKAIKRLVPKKILQKIKNRR